MPNFAAWSHENLAKFAEEAYVKMKEQQEALEQATANFKDAMAELRKLANLVNPRQPPL
jgi:cell division protein ZapA (FtsZ GTPase activity inhibitor)